MAVLVGIALVATPAVAQEREDEGALSSSLEDYGGFVGLDMSFGDMAGESSVFAGLQAAMLMKHRVYFGFHVSGMVDGSDAFDAGYGGFMVGYVIPATSLLQFTAETVVGGAFVNPADEEGDDDAEVGLLVQPKASAEIRLARAARLGFGVGYRYIGDLEVNELDEGDFRNAFGSVTLRLGWF